MIKKLPLVVNFLRVVLDTNVYISATILGRLCEEIVQTCRFSDVKVFISKDIIDEIKDKVSHKFLWKDDQVNIFLESIMEFCEIVEIEEKISYIKDDSEYDKILECAVFTGSRIIAVFYMTIFRLLSILFISFKKLLWRISESQIID